jgi:CHAD domain-containing protein
MQSRAIPSGGAVTAPRPVAGGSATAEDSLTTAVRRETTSRYAADEGVELPTMFELAAEPDRRGRAMPDGAPLAESQVREQFEETYVDTADLRLAAAGLTLRLRSRGEDTGWHLDLSAGGASGPIVRLPSGPAAPAVPMALRQLVWARTNGAALLPVAEAQTARTVHRLVDATGQVVIRMVDDRVTARRLLPADGAGEAAPSAWREVGVELADTYGERIEDVDVRLRDRGLRVAATPPELTWLRGPDRDGRSDPVPPQQLTVTSCAGDVLLSYLRQQEEKLRTQDVQVRLDAPDGIHQMRVATRRIRSALTTFRPLFATDVIRPLGIELKWLAGELGAARDAEVLRDRVRAAIEEGSQDGNVAGVGQDADSELERTYRHAHDRVLGELNGERYHRLLSALAGLTGRPPFTRQAAVAAGTVLPRRVARSYGRLRRLVKAANAEPGGAERGELLHEARKAAKRARYAGESVSPVFGPDATAFAEAMERVQEALGEHHDSVVTRERLRQLGLHAPTTADAFVYGRLHALEELRTERSEEQFVAAWKNARRKSLHRWLH